MSLHFIIAISATVFIASIIPGPSMLLALTHGMQHGAKRTMASAFGNVAVTMVQALISIVGLGTILLAIAIGINALTHAIARFGRRYEVTR